MRLPLATVTPLLRAGVEDGTFLQPLLDILSPPPATLGAMNIQSPRSLNIVIDSLNTDTCYVRRRWETKDVNDLNNENKQLALCEMGADGVWGIAEAAFQVLKITPPWAINPAWPARVLAKEIEIASYLHDHRDMTAGEMLAMVLNALWSLDAGAFIPHLAAEQFNQEFNLMMQAIEPIFDAHQGGYLDCLEFVAERAKTRRQAGWISVRWSASSQATLSMHNFPSPHAVAIEVTSLKGLPDNEIWISSVQAFSFNCDGRPHWGQQNRLTSGQVEQMFGEKLWNWRSVLTGLTGGSWTFSTDHTVQRGVSSQPIPEHSQHCLVERPVRLSERELSHR